MLNNVFSQGRLMSNKFSRCGRLLSLALVIASLCSAPLSAIAGGQDKTDSQQKTVSDKPDDKSESKQALKDKVKIEAEAQDSSHILKTEASQSGNADNNELAATRPRWASPSLTSPRASESFKPEAEKRSANAMNMSAPQLSSESRPGSFSLYFM